MINLKIAMLEWAYNYWGKQFKIYAAKADRAEDKMADIEAMLRELEE